MPIVFSCVCTPGFKTRIQDPAARVHLPYSSLRYVSGRARVTTRFPANGMHVPSDSFGGISPERKAANSLRTLFTFIAVKIILAQLEGSGRGALGAYDSKSYQTLMDQLEAEPFRDGDEWVEKLLQQDRLLALRVMEVRDAYCQEDFEWDQLQRLAIHGTKEANVKLMRLAVTASLKATSSAVVDPAARGAAGSTTAQLGGGDDGSRGEGPDLSSGTQGSEPLDPDTTGAGGSALPSTPTVVTTAAAAGAAEATDEVVEGHDSRKGAAAAGEKEATALDKLDELRGSSPEARGAEQQGFADLSANCIVAEGTGQPGDVRGDDTGMNQQE